MNVYRMTRAEVMDDLPMDQGFAMLAWAFESTGCAERASDGYVAQEMDRIRNKK